MFFFLRQKTAYEMRISDWSSDVCSSDLEGTIVIDETSMLDLALAATFFRSIEWQNVKRLILVGDHNQLPPIGRGRVFSDIIEWLREAETHNLAVLETNMRQMENRLEDGKSTSLNSSKQCESRMPTSA